MNPQEEKYAKEEARKEIKFLCSKRAKLKQEIEIIIANFCEQDAIQKERHYFLKLWQRLDDDRSLFKVVSYTCVLCRTKKDLEQDGNRCLICNEVLNNMQSESAKKCRHCGSDNLSSIGLPLSRIPEGAEIYSPFAEF